MNRFEKWSVWSTSFLTVATGAGYFVTKYLFSSPDPYSVVGHPWQPYFLKAHILVSPLLLFALGTITVRHVWDHFVSGVRWSRRSALLTAATVVPMVLTGYLIQVLTGEGWVRAMALSHIAFGTLYGAGLLAHTLLVRRGRREAAEEGREPPWREDHDEARETSAPAPGPASAPGADGRPAAGSRGEGPPAGRPGRRAGALKLSGAEDEE